MTGESLLLLKGHSRSHVTCKALCPFQTKYVVVVIELQDRIQSSTNGNILTL